MELTLDLAKDETDSRLQLLQYYFWNNFEHTERVKHLVWMIRTHPHVELLVLEGALNDRQYKNCRQAWVEVLDSTAMVSDADVLTHAAVFFAAREPERAVQLLEAAIVLNPRISHYPRLRIVAAVLRAACRLGDASSRVPLVTAAWATVRDLPDQEFDPTDRCRVLLVCTETALFLKDVEVVRVYASALLVAGGQLENTDLRNQSIHRGNIALGQCSVMERDIDRACVYLHAAAEVGGSQSWLVSGPDFLLASELLGEQRENDVVAYLQACKKLCPGREVTLERWIEDIKKGVHPSMSMIIDFGTTTT